MNSDAVAVVIVVCTLSFRLGDLLEDLDICIQRCIVKSR